MSLSVNSTSFANCNCPSCNKKDGIDNIDLPYYRWYGYNNKDQIITNIKKINATELQAIIRKLSNAEIAQALEIAIHHYLQTFGQFHETSGRTFEVYAFLKEAIDRKLDIRHLLSLTIGNSLNIVNQAAYEAPSYKFDIACDLLELILQQGDLPKNLLNEKQKYTFHSGHNNSPLMELISKFNIDYKFITKERRDREAKMIGML